MPNKGVRTAKNAKAARANATKAGRAHTLRAAEKRFGKLSAREKIQTLTHAERYAKARADKEEQIAKAKRLSNDERSRELIPSQEVHDWRRRLITGIRRELESLKNVLLEVIPDPDLTERLTKGAAIVDLRIRKRLQAMPELAGMSDA